MSCYIADGFCSYGDCFFRTMAQWLSSMVWMITHSGASVLVETVLFCRFCMINLSILGD